MFLLNGSPLQIDVAFKYNGISYPSNWLRLATADEKAAVGITEAPDPAVYDDRFYWNFGVPKDLSDLKKSWSQQIDNQAYTILLPSDWMVVRKAEGGADVPADWSTYRAAVRAKAAEVKTALNGASDIESFISAVTNIQWPRKPNAPAL
jgi:hypothetical protein